jgi:hypothetical protein
LPPRAEPALDDELYEVLPQFLPNVLPAGFVTEDPPATRVGGGNDFQVRRSYRRADGSFVDLALLLMRSKHEGATATLEALSKSAGAPKTLAGFPALFGPATAGGNQQVSIALTARLQIDVQFKGLSNQVLEDIVRGLSPEYLAQVEAGGRSAIDALSRTREFEDAQGEKVQMATGQSAFADRVVAMDRGPQRSGNPGDPNRALGPPDRNKDAGFYALGCRGSIQLAFDDNVLADGPGPDLHIFEVGGFVETISVRISEDGQSWIDAGQVKGQPASLDITKVAKPGARYRFVEITDLGNECGNEFPGADIDAVGAINGQLFASQNAHPVPPSSGKNPGPKAASEDELRRVAEAVQKSEGVPLNVSVDKEGWKMSEKNGGYTVQTSGVARANVDGKGSIDTVFINTRRSAQRAEHQLEIYTERQNGGLGPLAQVVIGYGEPSPSAGTLRVNGNRISFSMSGTPYVYELRGSTLFPVKP